MRIVRDVRLAGIQVKSASYLQAIAAAIQSAGSVALDMRAIGCDLGEIKLVIEAVEIIAHNAKFDLLWLRHKVGLRAGKVFSTLVDARLLSAGTKPGNELDNCLERYLGIPAAADHSLSDRGSMFLVDRSSTTPPAMWATCTPWLTSCGARGQNRVTMQS